MMNSHDWKIKRGFFQGVFQRFAEFGMVEWCSSKHTHNLQGYYFCYQIATMLFYYGNNITYRLIHRNCP